MVILLKQTLKKKQIRLFYNFNDFISLKKTTTRNQRISNILKINDSFKRTAIELKHHHKLNINLSFSFKPATVKKNIKILVLMYFAFVLSIKNTLFL